MADKTILITGITGQQGGAIARALVGRGFALRGLTREPGSDKAKEVEQLGVELVQGDLDDERSLRAALTGAWGTFAVQNTWEAGVEREEEQGKRMAKVARDVGVSHFVYSSVGSAHRKTGIPHFDNKWRVEETVRSLDFPSYVVLRPVFFMENLPSPMFLHGDKLISTLEPTTKLQMVAVKDIGALGARAFTHADEMKGHEIDLASDAATLPEAAGILSKALGRSIEYVRIPVEEVRKTSEDLALMLEWFDRVGYDADIDGVAKKYDLRPTPLAEWAQKTLKS